MNTITSVISYVFDGDVSVKVKPRRRNLMNPEDQTSSEDEMPSPIGSNLKTAPKSWSPFDQASSSDQTIPVQVATPPSTPEMLYSDRCADVFEAAMPALPLAPPPLIPLAGGGKTSDSRTVEMVRPQSVSYRVALAKKREAAKAVSVKAVSAKAVPPAAPVSHKLEAEAKPAKPAPKIDVVTVQTSDNMQPDMVFQKELGMELLKPSKVFEQVRFNANEARKFTSCFERSRKEKDRLKALDMHDRAAKEIEAKLASFKGKAWEKIQTNYATNQIEKLAEIYADLHRKQEAFG